MLSRLVLILGFTVTALLLFSSVSLTLSKPIEDGTDNIDNIGLSSLKEQERKNEPAVSSAHDNVDHGPVNEDNFFDDDDDYEEWLSKVPNTKPIS